jgi:hypothetical protein
MAVVCAYGEMFGAETCRLPGNPAFVPTPSRETAEAPGRGTGRSELRKKGSSSAM